MKVHVLILLYGALLISCDPKQTKESSKPNIIFIMSDDHASKAISAYGSGLNSTPNIDRIAKEGALFSRASVTNALCAPSRAVMLTGTHSFINGKVDNVNPFNWEQSSFPKILQSNGYQTALIGKIHLEGNPMGFDHSMVLPGQGEYYNPVFIQNGDTIHKEGYVTDIITDEALSWLKQRDETKPFCLLYHHKAPHRNWKPDIKYLNLYDDVTFDPPANFFDKYENRGSAAREQEMEVARDGKWGHDFKLLVNPGGDSTELNKQLKRLTHEQRNAWIEAYKKGNQMFLEQVDRMSEEEIAHWKYDRYIKDYLRTVKSVDDGVGRVLDYLDENGLKENTIVVYTSDQGFFIGEHGWFDKRFMYEESFRTPLLVRYPKEIKAGTTSDALVQNLDFAPTFLDYAGIEIPKFMQGASFRNLLNGAYEEWRDVAYYTYYQYPSIHMVKRHHGIATNRYKLIHFYYDVDEWELYDLKNDPGEMRNIYDIPMYSEVQKKMHQILQETRAHYGDSDESDQQFVSLFLENKSKTSHE